MIREPVRPKPFYTYCNQCYRPTMNWKPDEIKWLKNGSQKYYFNCRWCGSTTTHYTQEYNKIPTLIKRFVICKHCGYLWNTRIYGQGDRVVQCPDCKRKMRRTSEGVFKFMVRIFQTDLKWRGSTIQLIKKKYKIDKKRFLQYCDFIRWKDYWDEYPGHLDLTVLSEKNIPYERKWRANRNRKKMREINLKRKR